MTATPRYLLMATHVPASGSLGGIVRYTVGLAEALSRRTDIELHVLASQDAGEFFARMVPAERVHLVRSGPTALHSIREWLGATGALRSGRFDIVHGTKHIVPRRARGATRVLTVHDMLLLDRAHDFSAAKRLLLRTPYRDSIRRSDVVVAVSHATRARVTDYFPAAAERIKVTPLAAASTLTDSAAEPVEALLDRRFALVVGDAGLRKNLDLAVRTWSQVRDRVPGAVLAVVGPKPWGVESRGGREWNRLESEGALVQLRNVPDSTLRWCYENAAVVLCPSLIEGFGLPTVEAAAFGTKVVTSDDPALCEASAGWGTPSAAWNQEDWVTSVVGALAGDATGTPPPQRTWDDVAAETVAAALGRDVRDGGSLTPDGGRNRIGVSPFRASMRVLHVVASGDARTRADVEELAALHRDSGWKVDVSDDTALTDDEPAVDLGAGSDVDVVALHGLRAGRLRSRIQGRVPTVLFAGHERPRGLSGRIREASLARFTNALVVPSTGSRQWDRVHAPIARLDSTIPQAAEEMAEIMARARAWGSVQSS